MDTRRAMAAVLVVALLVGAAPAVYALANYAVPIQGTVPVSTGQTPTIYLESAGSPTDVNMVDMWNGSRLELLTAAGNATVRGDPGASATLAVGDITGSQTQLTGIIAGSNWLDVDPADKNRVAVRGDVDALAWSTLQADDGSTDLQLSGTVGGTAELRLYGLAASTTYGLYDASRDEVLANFSTDADGLGTTTVPLPAGSHSLQLRSAADFMQPALSNPDPEGVLSSPPDTLSVDVAAQAWPVTVDFTLDGQPVGSETLTANGTASTSVTVDVLDAYNWSASATDAVGQSTTLDAQFETPRNLTFREEGNATEIIDNTTVTIRFYTVDGEIAIQRESTNGSVNMSGLPDSAFVVFATSPTHYDRTIYVESIYEQNTMFLLNSTAFPRAENEAIRSRFIYEDFTGQFPSGDTTIQIRRPLDVNGDGTLESRVIAGDFWGAANSFEAVLERGARYEIVLVNRETGERFVAGSHIPVEDLTQTIRVTGIVEEAKNASGVVGLATLNATAQEIDIAYNDPVNETAELRVVVEPRGGGAEIYNRTVSGPLGAFGDTVSLNASQAERAWVVHFTAARADGSERYDASHPVGSGSLTLPVSLPWWFLALSMTMLVTFVGALYGPRTKIMGAWAMVFVAAGAALFGLAFSGPGVVVAGLIAVGVTLHDRALP